jgi:hypothetical protein
MIGGSNAVFQLIDAGTFISRIPPLHSPPSERARARRVPRILDSPGAVDSGSPCPGIRSARTREAYDTPEARALSAAAGFDHHVCKPINFDELATLLS